MSFVAMALVVEKDYSVLLAVCDTLLSNGTFSSSMPFGTKVLPLHNPGESGWLVGYAGDPTRFPVLRDYIAHAVAPDDTSNAVVEGARLAYQAYRTRLIENEILGTYGMTMADFLAHGLTTFGEAYFGSLCERIEGFDVGVELILGGFPSSATPTLARLARVFNPGIVINDFTYGVAAIGEGAGPSLEYLYTVHNRFDSMGAGLYRLLEAKFIADSTTRSVGRETTLLIVGPDNSINGVSNSKCEKVRSLWNRRRREVPRNMYKLLTPDTAPWVWH